MQIFKLKFRDATKARLGSFHQPPGCILAGDHSQGDKVNARQLEALIAIIMVALLPVRALGILGQGSLTPGVVLSLAIALPIATSIRHYQRLCLILVLTLMSLASAPVLIELSSVDHSLDPRDALAVSLFLLLGAWSLLALLWARERIGVRGVALAFSVGGLIQAALSSHIWAANPWKYGFAWPVTIFVAALLYKKNSRVRSVLALVVICAVSILGDYRSFPGFCIIVGALFLYRWNRAKPLSRNQIGGAFVVLAGAAYGFYLLGVWLALNGYLGLRNQLVTTAQINAGGSALAAGRIESGASFSLFRLNPLGFGPGVSPNSIDVMTAKTGLLGRGTDVNGTYVNEYLLGNGFKLHSILADLWVNFGLAGLALGLVFTALLLGALARLISSKSPAILPLFAVIIALWDMAFSPISNFNELILALALILRRSPAGEGWVTRFCSTESRRLPADPPAVAGGQVQLE